MRRKDCVFVIGHESSGSTLIAKIISHALNGNKNWNGRGFNCCNSPICDEQNDFIHPCIEVEHLVCHRSLPFMLEPKWPPISRWLDNFNAIFIICTRDTTISKLSVKSRFGRDLNTINHHQKKANQIISELLERKEKSFIWSYETFMFLKEVYLDELYSFLNLKSNYYPDTLIDANLKYIQKD